MVKLNPLLTRHWPAALVAGMLCSPLSATAEVTARLERDTIYLDQTVRLIIESNQAGNNGVQPDYSALGEDFTVLGTSSSQQITFLNGQQTSIKSWVTELEPKAEGTFTIAPIAVGGDQTPMLEVTVLPQDADPTLSDRDIHVELEVDEAEYYVQQQINLVIRLFLGINIADGTLSEPEAADVVVERLGQDVRYQGKRGNRVYQVIEREYALFPSRSGMLEISPIRFQGIAQDTGTDANPLFSGFLNQGKRVRAKSRPVTLKINPPDPAFSGSQWLPAKNLQILDQTGDYGTVTVGQAVTRKIEMNAVGLTAEQLPEIVFPTNRAVRQYPDRPVYHSRDDGRNMVSSLSRNIAIIALNEGEIELPGIEVHWWNTESNRMETAVLPPKTIRAHPDPALTSTALAEPPRFPSERSATGSPALLEPVRTDGDQADSRRWRWISIFVLVGWILTTVYLLRTRNPVVPPPAPDGKSAVSETSKTLKRNLQQACRDNDAASARQLVRQWSRALWPYSPPRSLDEFSMRMGSVELAEELSRLDRCLYHDPRSGVEGTPWQGNRLERILAGLPEKMSEYRSPDRPGLPLLYPR